MDTKPKKKIMSFYIDESLVDIFKEHIRKTCGNAGWLLEKMIKKEIEDNKK